MTLEEYQTWVVERLPKDIPDEDELKHWIYDKVCWDIALKTDN